MKALTLTLLSIVMLLSCKKEHKKDGIKDLFGESSFGVFDYRVNDGSIKILRNHNRVVKTGEDFIIPDYIENLPVKNIGNITVSNDEATEGGDNLSFINLVQFPNTVENISTFAIGSNVTTVTLGSAKAILSRSTCFGIIKTLDLGWIENSSQIGLFQGRPKRVLTDNDKCTVILRSLNYKYVKNNTFIPDSMFSDVLIEKSYDLNNVTFYIPDQFVEEARNAGSIYPGRDPNNIKPLSAL